GGIEKADGTGTINYEPDNHHLMVNLRQAKVDGIAQGIPDLIVDDPGGAAEVLVLGWGSTFGPISAAVRAIRAEGGRIAQAHLRHINPFPANTGDILRGYSRVIVPEMNLGQLALLLRARYLVDIQGFNQVRGLPFSTAELVTVLSAALAAQDSVPQPQEVFA
ncbi:MAG: 2-oxoacid:acceptor oxidoreductase subunit alpha, partial [Angustibacter sp.]